MEAQDAPNLFIYKLWPWVEENRKQIIIGAAAIVAIVLIYSFISYRHDQGEIAAGQAMTQALVSEGRNATPDEVAKALLDIAANHPGTAAAARAQLQGATGLFAAGQYADAQTQFQKFLDANPDSSFKGVATFGVAASLEAQGQSAQALTYYQRVADDTDPATTLAAKFAVARLDEQAGRLNDALTYYETVASAGNTQLGAEAGIRAIEIKAKIPTQQPAAPSLLSKP